MSELIISFIAFGCIFGSVLLGMWVQTLLPKHHLSVDSRDTVKLGTGMIATLAALILGLLVASAKGNFDTVNSGVMQTGSKIILLDSVMADYGPQTEEARHLLRRAIATGIEQTWPKEMMGQGRAKAPDLRYTLKALQNKLLQLSPQNEAQRWLQSRALQVYGDIAEARWLIMEERGNRSLPMPLFVILVFWLTLIFFSFGLFSPRNATVIVILLVCALSTAGSLYMIQELDHPTGGRGLITISSAPMRNALEQIGR